MYMGFDVEYTSIAISVKYLVVVKDFPTPVIGIVIIKYAMHLSSTVASVSRCTLLQVHIGIIYMPTVKIITNAQCYSTFPFLSGVKNHRRVHLSQRLFKCFAGGCKSSFKHPQDLHRHIAKHIGKHFTCEKCGHSTYQARLLQRHQVVHQSKQKYKCSFVH